MTEAERYIATGWTLEAEHASIRQHVKHGYILVWKKGRSESVVSWKIYRTKKLALAIAEEIKKG